MAGRATGNDFLFEGLDTGVDRRFLWRHGCISCWHWNGGSALAGRGAGAAPRKPRHLQRDEHAAPVVGTPHRDPSTFGPVVEHVSTRECR